MITSTFWHIIGVCLIIYALLLWLGFFATEREKRRMTFSFQFAAVGGLFLGLAMVFGIN